MLNQAIVAIMTNDRKLVVQISQMDITRLTDSAKQSFVINLKHIGDIIDKNLMELAIRARRG
jgi:hypothetical protein